MQRRGRYLGGYQLLLVFSIIRVYDTLDEGVAHVEVPRVALVNVNAVLFDKLVPLLHFVDLLHVLAHVELVHGAVVAYGANVRLRLGVGERVAVEVHRRFEDLPAHTAGKVIASVVVRPVDQEFVLVGERFAAVGTNYFFHRHQRFTVDGHFRGIVNRDDVRFQPES